VSYLQPPPNMSPVVVVKDFGGYVDQYTRQTEIYRRTNREVRIHECHSACTMALGLPNVCVYPNSIFKFHQAYDPRNHVVNLSASDDLFNTYPLAVRQRLGTLTKRFTILRGDELIQLGVRACNEPQPRILIAKASTTSESPSGTTLSMLTGKLQGMIPNLGLRPQNAPSSGSGEPGLPTGVLRPKVPLPPEKPTSDGEEATGEEGGVPLPPPRPSSFPVAGPSLPPSPVVRIIAGGQQILPAHFVPYPKGA
jgi:hypothetical protein